VLAFEGALIPASFLANSFSPTLERSKTGVPFAEKKWKPRIGKEPSPGMERGEKGIRVLVRGWVTACGGMEEAVEAERKERGVTS